MQVCFFNIDFCSNFWPERSFQPCSTVSQMIFWTWTIPGNLITTDSVQSWHLISIWQIEISVSALKKYVDCSLLTAKTFKRGVLCQRGVTKTHTKKSYDEKDFKVQITKKNPTQNITFLFVSLISYVQTFCLTLLRVSPFLPLSLSLSEHCPQMAFGLLFGCRELQCVWAKSQHGFTGRASERARDGGIERARDSEYVKKKKKNHVKWDRDSALCCRYALSASASLFQQIRSWQLHSFLYEIVFYNNRNQLDQNNNNHNYQKYIQWAVYVCLIILLKAVFWCETHWNWAS